MWKEEVEVEMPNQVFDQKTALSRVDDDMELFREISALFFDESAKLLGEIREAMRLGDMQKLEIAAHTLKGAISNFFAKDAFDAALKMEMAAREKSLREVEAAYPELDRQVERLVSALWTFSEQVMA